MSRGERDDGVSAGYPMWDIRPPFVFIPATPRFVYRPYSVYCLVPTLRQIGRQRVRHMRDAASEWLVQGMVRAVAFVVKVASVEFSACW